MATRAEVISLCGECYRSMDAELDRWLEKAARCVANGLPAVVDSALHQTILETSNTCIQLLKSVRQNPQNQEEADDQAAIAELLRAFGQMRAAESPEFTERVKQRSDLLGRPLTADEMQAMMDES